MDYPLRRGVEWTALDALGHTGYWVENYTNRAFP